jgi:radical SAM protein with 4Fe4S-binding SPASM domain
METTAARGRPMTLRGKSSSVGSSVILKLFWRMARHPWIGTKLARLQMEKWLLRVAPLPLDGRAKRNIRQVSVRITDLCNLRCHTCGQWGDNGYLHGQVSKELRRREVPSGRYCEILADLVHHGHRPLVYLWGGEPMLYDGLLDLVESASSMGLPTSIATNGARVARSADRIVAAPLFLLQVSVDGHTNEVHDRLRPSAAGGSSFGDVISALEAVHEARARGNQDLPLIASLTVVSRENFRHLVDLYEAFRDRVDLFVFYLSWWIDPDSANSHEQDFSRRFGFVPSRHRGWMGRWSPDDFVALEGQLAGVLARSRPWNAPPVAVIPSILAAEDLRAYYTDHSARFGFDRCVSIHQVVEINSNGDVSPCRDYHDYVVGNILESTIGELWNSEAYCRFRSSVAKEGLMPVCSRCCGLMGY